MVQGWERERGWSGTLGDANAPWRWAADGGAPHRASPGSVQGAAGPQSWRMDGHWVATLFSDTFFSPTIETRETEVRAVCDVFGGRRCGHRGLWGEPLCLGQRSVSPHLCRPEPPLALAPFL